jgi:hypothetical protein
MYVLFFLQQANISTNHHKPKTEPVPDTIIYLQFVHI